MELNSPTQEEFDRILIEVLSKMRASQLIAVGGIYEILAEEYNNEILSIWETRRSQNS